MDPGRTDNPYSSNNAPVAELPGPRGNLRLLLIAGALIIVSGLSQPLALVFTRGVLYFSILDAALFAAAILLLGIFFRSLYFWLSFAILLPGSVLKILFLWENTVNATGQPATMSGLFSSILSLSTLFIVFGFFSRRKTTNSPLTMMLAGLSVILFPTVSFFAALFGRSVLSDSFPVFLISVEIIEDLTLGLLILLIWKNETTGGATAE